MSDNDDIENDFDNDDFDTEDFDDGGFDELETQQGTLGDLWRNNPLVKAAVILAAFAFLVGGVILFGGKKDRLPPSQVTASREVSEAPGESEISEAYKQAIEEEDTRRIEDALRQGESAVPTLVGPAKSPLDLQFEEPEEEDPLERWRRMQEERIRQQQVQVEQQPEEIPEPEEDTRTPAVNALAQAMSTQMESVLGNQQIKGPILLPVADITYLEALAEKERQRLEEALERQVASQPPFDPDSIDIILPAGTIEYAQLITEANTDAPGPVLAQIATGPLKGGKLIGNFTSTDDYLTLNFTAVVIDGVDYSATAVALDPDTTLPGVVTDIDRRYFKRVILPAASEFVTGFTEAIANSGTTTITINNADGTTTTQSTADRDNEQEVASGVAEAGEAFADIIDEMADRTQPLLRVRAGTPIGVLFVEPVVDEPRIIEQERVRQQQLQQQQFISNGTGGFDAFNPATINVVQPQ
jgi:intracellular multiplication protein IcmE